MTAVYSIDFENGYGVGFKAGAEEGFKDGCLAMREMVAKRFDENMPGTAKGIRALPLPEEPNV